MLQPLPLRPRRWPLRRRRSACGRPRIAARPCSAIRCRSSPRSISSIGSRTRTATFWPGWSSPNQTRCLELAVDLVAEMTVINPFDFFLDAEATKYPFRYPEWLARRPAPYLEGPCRRERSSRSSWPAVPRKCEVTVDFLVDLNQLRPRRGEVRHPHGAGRADLRGNAHAGQRLLPRFGLAAGADAAAPGPGRAVRFRLLDPVEAGHQAAGRAGRHRTTTSPTCTPGPKSICPAPAGSASIRPPACWPAKGICRWPPRPIRLSAAPITGCIERCEASSISP